MGSGVDQAFMILMQLGQTTCEYIDNSYVFCSICCKIMFKWPWGYETKWTVIACDTSSQTHSYLCPVWKWYIQNCMHCRVIKFVRNYVVLFSSRSLDFLWTYSFLFLFIIPLMMTVFLCHCCDTDVGQENIIFGIFIIFCGCVLIVQFIFVIFDTFYSFIFWYM